MTKVIHIILLCFVVSLTTTSVAFAQGSSRSSEGSSCSSSNRNVGVSVNGNGKYCLDSWDGNDFIEIQFENQGIDTVVTITYAYNYEGTQFGPFTINLDLATNNTYQMPLNLANILPGSHSINFWIVNVNGLNDECTQNDSILYQFTTSVVQQVHHPLIDATVCAGSQVQLHADTSFVNYGWTTGETTNPISVYTSALYKVKLTDLNGCVNYDSALVEHFPVNKPLNNLEAKVCANELPYSLSIPSSFASVVWNDQTLGNTFSTNSSGQFKVTYVDSFGCAGSDSLFVGVNQLQNISFPSTHFYCEGDSVELEIQEGFASYQWSTDDQNPSITMDSAGQYSVVVVDSNGCEQTATTQVLKQELPVIDWSSDSILCTGGNLEIDAGLHASYVWSTGDSTSSTVVQLPGKYSVSVSDSIGCENQGSFNVVERQAVVELGQDTSVCDGSLIFLSPLGNFDGLIWSDGTSGSSISIGQSGSYWVEATQHGKCVARDTITISTILFPYAEFSNQAIGGNVLFTNYSTSYDSLVWNFGDGKTSNLQNPSHYYSTPGLYSATLTAFNRCGNDSYSEEVRVIQTGDDEYQQLVEVKLSPNPTFGLVNIRIEGYNTDVNYTVLNAIGQTVENGVFFMQNGTSHMIDLSVHAKGTYFIHLQSDVFQETAQLILK